MQSFWSLGKKIYNMSNPREARRCVVFCARAMANRSRMRQIDAFFQQDAVLQQWRMFVRSFMSSRRGRFFITSPRLRNALRLLRRIWGSCGMCWQRMFCSIFIGINRCRSGMVRRAWRKSLQRFFFSSRDSVRRGFFPSCCGLVRVRSIRSSSG